MTKIRRIPRDTVTGYTLQVKNVWWTPCNTAVCGGCLAAELCPVDNYEIPRLVCLVADGRVGWFYEGELE